MKNAEIVIGLLAGVALLAAIAQRAGLPYAAVLVLGGLVLGVIPGIPRIHLDPQLVLLGFLPPLVYATAFQAASYNLRPNLVHILTLATGLVLLTVVVVAAAGRAVAGLPWVSAFVLGALAAPTDPVSASSVMRDVGAPERVVAILEGESLINDGTGLAAFQVAVVAAGGGISVGSGVLRFIAISVGGAAVGLVAGWVLVRLRRRLDEPSLEIVLGLLAAFGSYVAAYAIGWSGVLAAVTAGLYAGRHAEDISSAGTRLNVEPFWDALTFVLESMLFLLIGLQLPSIVSGLHGSVGTGILDGAVIVAVVFAVRGAWMATLRVMPPAVGRTIAAVVERLPGAGRLATSAGEPLSGRELTVLGFSGMRGSLSLAGALSIPLLVSHHAFAARDQVIFLVYIVVIGTLVLPSLMLETVVRRLGLAGEDELRRLDLEARTRIVHAGLARLDELGPESGVPQDTIDRLRALLELRLERLDAQRRRDGAGPGDGSGDGSAQADLDAAVHRLRREVIGAERQALAELRERRRVPAQVLARIQRDIDLDEIRLH
ncbi:MAG TPA: Na+/H+ antiporter [Solirubrobacteraceae bacterium]|nr:Na+/H+ antiporter [Solirubrobacteraceae bacterium]